LYVGFFQLQHGVRAPGVSAHDIDQGCFFRESSEGREPTQGVQNLDVLAIYFFDSPCGAILKG
jgi:hypothetical protein